MNTFDYECPDCGGPMVLRTNHQTKEQFFGCCSYPECTGTRAVEGDSKHEAAQRHNELPSDRHRWADRNRWRNE